MLLRVSFLLVALCVAQVALVDARLAMEDDMVPLSLVETSTEHIYTLHWECAGRACGEDEDPDHVLDENWQVVFSNNDTSIVPYAPSYRVLINPRSDSVSRTCVFFHGVGGGELWPHTYGHIFKNGMFEHLDCRRIYLARFPTHELIGGWQNEWLQDLHVKLIQLAGYDPRHPTLTKIFAHEFANLALAGAVMNSRFMEHENHTCLWGKDMAWVDGEKTEVCKGPNWMATGAPLEGMDVVRTLWNLCHKTVNSIKTHYTDLFAQFDMEEKDLRHLLQWVGRCKYPFKTEHGLYTSYAYYSMHPEHTHLANGDVKRTAYYYLDGAMCGACPAGLGAHSRDAKAMRFAAELADFGSADNDGMTRTTSCVDDAEVEWADDWKPRAGTYYRAQLNNGDTSGISGEAQACAGSFTPETYNDRDREHCPLQWFIRMSALH